MLDLARRGPSRRPEARNRRFPPPARRAHIRKVLDRIEDGRSEAAGGLFLVPGHWQESTSGGQGEKLACVSRFFREADPTSQDYLESLEEVNAH